MAQHQWFEPHTSPVQRWWLRAFSHTVKETSFGKLRDMSEASRKVAKLQRVKLISQLIEAIVNDCRSRLIHDVWNIIL